MEQALETGSHGERVKLRILETGLRLWHVNPSYVSARRIAQELGLTHSAVLYHFGHSAAMIDAIAFHAVKQGEARVIVSLIGMQHKCIAHMDNEQLAAWIKAARAD